MDAIIETGHFKGDALVVLGVCRKFKAVHMISYLVKCNDREIRTDILDSHEGQSLRQFPRERPTPTKLSTWNDTVSLFASKKVNGKMCLPTRLQRFL